MVIEYVISAETLRTDSEFTDLLGTVSLDSQYWVNQAIEIGGYISLFRLGSRLHCLYKTDVSPFYAKNKVHVITDIDLLRKLILQCLITTKE